MAEVEADVWILTEAHPQAAPHKSAVVASQPMLTPEDSLFTLVAAPQLEAVGLPEVPTGAAAVVTHEGTEWLVVGVCMPWRRGAPDLPDGAAPGAMTGPEQWHAVIEELDRALKRLRLVFPEQPLLLGGDFNQTLHGLVVGSSAGRSRLRRLLVDHGLTAYTEMLPAALDGSAAVDHLIGSAATRASGTWMPPLVPNRERRASDHAGYWVDV